jgi:hypothetical protein
LAPPGREIADPSTHAMMVICGDAAGNRTVALAGPPVGCPPPADWNGCPL